jgi:hypothetical protein
VLLEREQDNTKREENEASPVGKGGRLRLVGCDDFGGARMGCTACNNNFSTNLGAFSIREVANQHSKMR